MITDNSQVEIPQALIDEQADAFIHDFAHRLEHQGLNIDDYVKYMNTTVEDLKKSRLDDAKKTVRTRLVLEAVMEKEGIKLEREELEKAIADHAKFNGMEVEEFKKTVHDHYLNDIANNLLIGKLFDFLKKNNNL